jgi:branched-chain amino acid aminotransferase
LVNRKFVRACPGGLGEAKTAANYAASIYPQACAEKLGCDQVLYLDAIHHEAIDELGGMNFFVIHKNELITPELNGAILNGVTRRSLLEMASTVGLKAVERRLTMSEVISGVRSGDIREAFACGTAAVIQPIGELVLQEREGAPTENLKIPGPFDKCLELRSELVKLQRGRSPDPFQWRYLV